MNSNLIESQQRQSHPSATNGSLSVALIDDDPEFQRAVRGALLPTHWALDMCPDYANAPRASWLSVADIVVLGACASRPEPVRCLRELRASRPRCPILIASTETDAAFICRCFSLGAWGYLLKAASLREIVWALAETAAGRRPLAPPAVAALASDANGSRTVCLAVGLSSRQWQIAQLRARGLSEGTIADRLGIAAQTVHSHMKRIHTKWEIHDRRELALRVSSAGDRHAA
jgi:DNA-binding NarL/FixJ family response regulator